MRYINIKNKLSTKQFSLNEGVSTFENMNLYLYIIKSQIIENILTLSILKKNKKLEYLNQVGSSLCGKTCGEHA